VLSVGLFGGGFGATLAVVYAQSFPQHVLGMICLLPAGEIEHKEWLFGKEGISQVYPDYWEDYMAPIPHDMRHYALYQYHELLTSDNEITRTRAAETGRSGKRVVPRCC